MRPFKSGGFFSVIQKVSGFAYENIIFLISVPFVLFSSVIIGMSGQTDTWPTEEEMKHRK